VSSSTRTTRLCGGGWVEGDVAESHSTQTDERGRESNRVYKGEKRIESTSIYKV